MIFIELAMLVGIRVLGSESARRGRRHGSSQDCRLPRQNPQCFRAFSKRFIYVMGSGRVLSCRFGLGFRVRFTFAAGGVWCLLEGSWGLSK